LIATDVSETAFHIVASVAIVVGGLWTLATWGYDELRRRHREHPDLDGQLSASQVDAGGGRVIVTLDALWRNRGQTPVELDRGRSLAEVYVLDSKVLTHPMEIDKRSEPAASSRARWATYLIGAKSESQMQAHFVLDADGVYLLRWKIGLPHDRWCQRDLVWCPAEHV